jgi:hypothetical protein
MNAAEVLMAVREAGAALRVEGDSLVASHASRIAPAIKAAIREHKPQLIAALLTPPGPACRVTIVEIPATGLRYRRTYAHLQLRPPAYIPEDRWRMAIEDGRAFLHRWGEHSQALNWSSADLFSLAPVPAKPHPSYRRLSRYDCTGLVWRLEGRPVVALTESTAAIENATGNITIYRRFHKPSYGAGRR